MNPQKKYESKFAKILWDDRGFFIITLKDENHTYDLEETKNQFKYFKEITNGEPYKVIVDYRLMIAPPTQDAFEYFVSENTMILKTAIVADNLGISLMFSQLINHHQLKNMGLFKEIEAAVDWILSIER